ncbi:hypothetical protein [Abyssisolibacter fermentans]|nr:hypothetical protein [Abyssisolibacter fermentans]
MSWILLIIALIGDFVVAYISQGTVSLCKPPSGSITLGLVQGRFEC